MSGFDTRRLARLARTLGVPAHRVVLAAARLAERRDDDSANAAAFLRRIEREALVRAGDGVAALLVTPIADFAQDDVDRALASGGDADA